MKLFVSLSLPVLSLSIHLLHPVNVSFPHVFFRIQSFDSQITLQPFTFLTSLVTEGTTFIRFSSCKSTFLRISIWFYIKAEFSGHSLWTTTAAIATTTISTATATAAATTTGNWSLGRFVWSRKETYRCNYSWNCPWYGNEWSTARDDGYDWTTRATSYGSATAWNDVGNDGSTNAWTNYAWNDGSDRNDWSNRDDGSNRNHGSDRYDASCYDNKYRNLGKFVWNDHNDCPTATFAAATTFTTTAAATGNVTQSLCSNHEYQPLCTYN